MPKIVDHGERREEILAAARRVIVRDGLDAATTRAIAAEAGYSHGVLAHYFADKDAILLSALRSSHEDIEERLTAKIAGRGPLAALRELLLDNLPLDPQRADETRLEMTFWSRALASSALAEVQRAEHAKLRDGVVLLLGMAADAGEAEPRSASAETADRLLALIDGLSVHHLLYPDRVPAARVRTLMEAELAALTKRDR